MKIHYRTALLFLLVTGAIPAFSQRWSYTSLSKGKLGMSAGVIGDKIMFFAGSTYVYPSVNLVNEAELFDIRTGQSVFMQLDPAAGRDNSCATSVGSKLIFAGGDNGWATNRVDIYDTLTGTWSTTQLSLDRYFIAPVSIHNKALFAGGSSKTVNRNASNVDIYNLLTDSWSYIQLPAYHASTELTPYRRNIGGIGYGSKAYFAGGVAGVYEDDACNMVSVLDAASNTWLPSLPLSNRKSDICTGAYNGKVYFASGSVRYYEPQSGNYFNYPSDSMNVYDTLSGAMSTVKIPRLLYYNPVDGKRPWVKSVQAGCKLFLIPQPATYPNGSPDTIAIYDMARNTWAFEALPHPRTNITAAACKNKVYFAGGSNPTMPDIYFKSDIDIYTLSPVLKTAVDNVFTNSFDMGSIEEHATKQVTLQISNEGDYDLLFDPAATYTLSGDLAAFSIDPLALPGLADTLAPAAVISIPVEFHPASTGSYSATLTISSNDPLTPVHSFQISGTATQTMSVLNAVSASYIKLYPNPAKGTVSIENNGTQVFTTLEIINPQGMVVKQQTVQDSSATADVSALTPGMYFVRLSNSTSFTVVKLIKE